MKKAIVSASIIALTLASFSAFAFDGKPKKGRDKNQTCCAADKKCESKNCDSTKCMTDGKCDKSKCTDKNCCGDSQCSSGSAGGGCCAPKK
jgi:hypothetical protein